MCTFTCIQSPLSCLLRHPRLCSSRALSVCRSYALFLWAVTDTAGDGERITHPSELKDLEWASWNSVYGYPVLGACRLRA
jgi:hypothetical protein